MQQIILASNSPRRKELLSMLSVPFTVQESHVDERALEEADRKAGIRRTPGEQAAFMAEAKGTDVSRTAPANSIIIAADTMVADGDTILHKPKDKADAKAILTHLSGGLHGLMRHLQRRRRQRNGTRPDHRHKSGVPLFNGSRNGLLHCHRRAYGQSRRLRHTGQRVPAGGTDGGRLLQRGRSAFDRPLRRTAHPGRFSYGKLEITTQQPRILHGCFSLHFFQKTNCFLIPFGKILSISLYCMQIVDSATNLEVYCVCCRRN